MGHWAHSSCSRSHCHSLLSWFSTQAARGNHLGRFSQNTLYPPGFCFSALRWGFGHWSLFKFTSRLRVTLPGNQRSLGPTGHPALRDQEGSLSAGKGEPSPLDTALYQDTRLTVGWEAPGTMWGEMWGLISQRSAGQRGRHPEKPEH